MASNRFWHRDDGPDVPHHDEPVMIAAAADSPADIAYEVGERLVQQGALSATQLQEATMQQRTAGRPLGQLLVELGMVDETKLVSAVAALSGVAIVDLGEVEPDPAAVARLPEATARAAGVVPVSVDPDGTVVLAAGDVADEATTAAVRAATGGHSVRFVLATPSDIQRAVNAAYRALAGAGSLVDAFEAAEAGRRVTTAAAAVSDDAPVVQLATLIMTQGLRDRASDIHIEPHSDRIRIRFRIDGALHDVLSLPENMGPALVSRIKILAKMNIVERRRPQDGQLAMQIDGRDIDVRVSTSPNIWGEMAVLRLLDRTRSLYRLSELGMSAQTYARYTGVVRSPYGMVVCAGPTGGGKTTTLYATLGELNQSERNIITIEDPVEYVFPSINQIQINDQAGVTFATGLRAILRQDPDVILVGEIRDPETARMAVESALTGHLVLSSIHATDACSALQRFVDMGIETFLISSTVTGVVSQRLMRRVCEQCREPYCPSVEELEFFRAAGGSDQVEFWRGRGCTFCARTGYQERVGVFELLPMSGAIKKLLADGATIDQLRAEAKAGGMQTLLDNGVELVEDGVTTVAELMSSVYML